MIVDQLFDNKKNTNESLADEFMAMARAKGYNPRLRGTPDEERARTNAMLAQRAADRANAPAPAPVSDEERAELEAQLQKLEANFDPDYEFSDDHSFWTQQKSIAQQIGAIKQKLSQGVAEDSDTAEDYRAKAQWLRSELHLSPDEAWERAYDTDPETWVGSPWEDDYKQGMAEGYETTPFGGVTNTTPNYSQAWKVTDEGEEFLRKAYQRLKRAYKEGGQVEMINIGPALSELQQQKFGPAYVQQSGPYQMMTTDISRLIEKIEPWQKQYNQQHIATDFDPEDFSNWNKEQRMSENTGRKVDANGRTQSEWMQLVKQKFPDARIVQAKMIDGPAHAMLPDGRKFSWTPVQGMAEAKKANTKTARAEFSKRPRAELSDKEKAKEKADSDAAWERLMAYADEKKKEQGVAEGKRNKKRKLDESWLMEDPVYRKFKKVGRYIAERKLTEPEILKIFADAEAGMTDKATGANRTWLGRGKDTTMDFAGGVADALKGVWSGIQSNVGVQAVDVAYDKATDALADVTGGQKGAIMQAIKKYRMLAKEYPKTAGLAKGALVAITGLATSGAGLPAVAALVYGLDSAIKGEKFSDIALKAGGAAATAWAAGKIASAVGGDQAGAGADAGGMGDPSQLPPFDDAGNLSPGFHISPDDKMPYYTGDLAPTPTDIAAGYGADSTAGLTAGATRFDDIVSNAVDYKIKDGDTLTQILADKKINPEAFRRLPGNDVYFGPTGNPDVIKAGDIIKLPRPEDIGALNKMSWTTPDSAGGNLQRFLDDPNYYTGQYNPNNSRFSLDAATNLKQQELGRYAASDIAANRVAQDAARATGGPELLGGPGAGDVAAAAAVPTPSPLNLQPPATPGGPQFGTVTLPDGQTLKAAAFPEGGITPRLPMGSTPVTINYNGQELTGRVFNDTVYFTKFPTDTVGSATTSGAGTLSGVTADQIYNSPVYQQAYAQEIARYGAEPSARAIQTAQQIATMKAKAAMAGAVKESTDFTRTVKMRTLSADKLIDQKLTTLSWALNESVGKPQGRSMHLTPLGVYTVFENIRRVGEAAAAATRIEPTFEPIDEYPPDPFPVPPRSTPAPAPAPAPTPAPKLSFGSPEDTINRSRRYSATTVPLKPTPAPTAPTGDAAGPGREQLPDLYRPDMPDAPMQPADPAKKSWFGRGLDALDRGAKAVGGAISNIGHQLTTNVTKEKLKMNWHQAGKPTDSDQLSAWLVKQGVPVGVVNGVYEKMGLPVSAEPTTPAKAVPSDTKPVQGQQGAAQRQMAYYGTNPKTQKPWTYDELARRQKEKIDLAAGDIPVGPSAPIDPTQTPAPPKIGSVPMIGFNASNVMDLPGMEKYKKPVPAKTPNFAGPSGYGKTTMSVKPMTGVPGMKPAAAPTATATAPAPTATATAPAPVSGPMKIGGQTLNPKNPADKKIIDKVQAQTAKVAEALKRPVAEMLSMVETKEDVAKIKQFIDQTFVKYGAVNESAFAVRNQLIEHVTQIGAQRRREFARKS